LLDNIRFYQEALRVIPIRELFSSHQTTYPALD